MIPWSWLISALLTSVAFAFLVVGFLVAGWLIARKIVDLENARWHAQMGWEYPLPPITYLSSSAELSETKEAT